MDFRAPQCVIDAMHARAEHGVYGYSVPREEVTQAVIEYLERTAHYKVCGQRPYLGRNHGDGSCMTYRDRTLPFPPPFNHVLKHFGPSQTPLPPSVAS
jgi:hypothetical protein